jgi:hypothetical protein
MLVENRWSNYEFRPRACRVYDCRIFTAADSVPDEPGRELIAERVNGVGGDRSSDLSALRW